MPYKVGAKGSYGCDGYPAVKEGGEVMGCHSTQAEAAAQIYAINRSEGNIGKAMPNLKEGDFAMTAHCLLYTSPSPRDRQKSRMPSSA